MKARIALYVAMATTFIAGCAGNAAITPNTPIIPANAYAGEYTSSVELDNGKTGAVVLTAETDGSVSGTMTVTGPPATAPTRAFEFSTGVFSVSGTVDENGNFNITGTDPVGGSFGIDGNFSLNGSGTINVRAGGQTFSSTVTIQHGGGSGSITFDNNGGANMNSAAFGSSPYIVMSTVGEFSAIVAVPSTSDTTRSISLLLMGDATTGAVVDLNGINTGRSNVGYGEGNGDKNWYATSGKMHVVSRTASGFEVRFENARFEAEDDGENNGTGSFVMNGTLKK